MRLAAGGKALVPVRLAAESGEVERFAAGELARYLGQISGAAFRVEPEDAAESGGIHVGRTAAARAAGLGPDPCFPDGYAIRSAGGAVFISGGDPRGTLFGVYRFLEELGCRFLAPNFDFYPGGCGEIVPRRRLLEAGALDIAEAPAFRVRRKGIEEGRSHTGERSVAIIDWMAKNRMGTVSSSAGHSTQDKRACWADHCEALIPELAKRGLELEVGGHGYESHLPAPELAAGHPEWFALKRGARRADLHASLCDSNPEALAALTDRVLGYIEAHPEIDVFDLWPPDESDCWCECERCRALGSVPERHMRLVRHVAAAVGCRFPEKTVEFLAYLSYTDPPETPPPPNSRMDFCSISRSFGTHIFDESDETNRRYWRALAAWRERCPELPVVIYSYYRKYAWKSLPVLLPDLVAAELARYRQVGAAGVGSFSEPGDWLTFEMQHWLVARLSWDPEEDVETVLAMYLQARYGDSAGRVREALRRAEPLWRTVFTGFHDRVASREHAARLVGVFGEIAAELASAGAEALSRSFGYARTYYAMWQAAWRGDAAGFERAVAALDREIEAGSSEGRVIPIKYMGESVEVARERLGSETR